MPGSISSLTPNAIVPGGSTIISGSGFSPPNRVLVFANGSYTEATVTGDGTTTITVTIPQVPVGGTGHIVVVNAGESVGAKSATVSVVSSVNPPSAFATGQYARSTNRSRPRASLLDYPVGRLLTNPSGGNVQVAFFTDTGLQNVSGVPTSELRFLTPSEQSYLDGKILNLAAGTTASSSTLVGRKPTILVSDRSSYGTPANPLIAGWGFNEGRTLPATLKTVSGTLIGSVPVRWVAEGRTLYSDLTVSGGAFGVITSSTSFLTQSYNLSPGEYVITPVFDGNADFAPSRGDPFSVRIQGVYTAVTLEVRNSSGTLLTGGSFIDADAMMSVTVVATPNKTALSPNNRVLLDVYTDGDFNNTIDMGILGPGFRATRNLTAQIAGQTSGPFGFQGRVINGPLSTDTDGKKALYVNRQLVDVGSPVNGVTALLTLEC